MSLACPAGVQALAPNLCRAVDHYCERTGAGLDAEPLNAVSNVAFLIAAWAAWRLDLERDDIVLERWVRALAIIIAVVGLGSLTFHTIATRWAEWADVIPILVFMLSYLWLAMTVYFRWPWPLRVLILAAYFGATLFLESGPSSGALWGGALYLPTLAVMGGAALLLWQRHPAVAQAFIAAGGVFVLSFAARTIDMPLCSALPIGTHYLWHVCNATVLYLLVQAIARHAPAGGR